MLTRFRFLFPPRLLRPALCLPGVQTDPEGSLWRDPPGYWESIVYPAYVQSSAGLFEGGDVEHGELAIPPPNAAAESCVEGEWEGEGAAGGARAVAGLLLIELLEMTMDEVVERVCDVLIKEVDGDE